MREEDKNPVEMLKTGARDLNGATDTLTWKSYASRFA